MLFLPIRIFVVFFVSVVVVLNIERMVHWLIERFVTIEVLFVLLVMVLLFVVSLRATLVMRVIVVIVVYWLLIGLLVVEVVVVVMTRVNSLVHVVLGLLD